VDRQVFLMVIGARARASRAPGSALEPALLAAFLGALVATSVHSTVIEKLNFRHVWLLLGMICAATAAPATAGARVKPAPRLFRLPRFGALLPRGGES
jgi:hypothetical protein